MGLLIKNHGIPSQEVKKNQHIEKLYMYFKVLVHKMKIKHYNLLAPYI